jgi:hypothetical protein
MVGDVAELLGGEHRVLEPVERIGMRLRDGVDELVEADGGSGGRLAHADNLRLSSDE